MKSLKRGYMMVALVALVAALSALMAGPVRAANTICTTFGISGVHDNVIVPSGETCTLAASTTVLGSVKVASGATFATSFSSCTYPCATIFGNVLAQTASTVSIACSTVFGYVHIHKSTGFTRITGSTIGDNLQITKQTSGSILVGPSGHPCKTAGPGNSVGGNIQLLNNTTPFPAKVGLNKVAHNLHCQSNTPGVTSTGVNIVGGNKMGQCAGF